MSGPEFQEHPDQEAVDASAREAESYSPSDADRAANGGDIDGIAGPRADEVDETLTREPTEVVHLVEGADGVWSVPQADSHGSELELLEPLPLARMADGRAPKDAEQDKLHEIRTYGARTTAAVTVGALSLAAVAYFTTRSDGTPDTSHQGLPPGASQPAKLPEASSKASQPPATVEQIDMSDLQTTLRSEAVKVATEAIALSRPSADGRGPLFQATQDGSGRVELTAGSDDFQPGTQFSGKQEVVEITLTEPGLQSGNLTSNSAAAVSEVFIEETVGVGNSNGDAVDTQTQIRNPPTTDSEDSNDLFGSLLGENGHENTWSGSHGQLDTRSTSPQWQGYDTDLTTVIPSGPAYQGMYWGGGEPPENYAPGGQDQTARDVARDTDKAFRAAVRDLEQS